MTREHRLGRARIVEYVDRFVYPPRRIVIADYHYDGAPYSSVVSAPDDFITHAEDGSLFLRRAAVARLRSDLADAAGEDAWRASATPSPSTARTNSARRQTNEAFA